MHLEVIAVRERRWERESEQVRGFFSEAPSLPLVGARIGKKEKRELGKNARTLTFFFSRAHTPPYNAKQAAVCWWEGGNLRGILIFLIE